MAPLSRLLVVALGLGCAGAPQAPRSLLVPGSSESVRPLAGSPAPEPQPSAPVARGGEPEEVPDDGAAAAVAMNPPPASLAPALDPIPEPPALLISRQVLAERAPKLSGPTQEEIARLLVRAQAEHGLSVLMLLALIDQESRFDPKAVGPKGSLGLMQVRPFVGRAVAQSLGVPFEGRPTLFDPVANVRIGVHYLAEQLREFGSTELALAAYNMGPTRLRRRLAAGNAGTPRYVHRVLQQYHGLRLRFGDVEVAIGG